MRNSTSGHYQGPSSNHYSQGLLDLYHFYDLGDGRNRVFYELRRTHRVAVLGESLPSYTEVGAGVERLQNAEGQGGGPEHPLLH